MTEAPPISKASPAETVGNSGFSIGEIVSIEEHFGFEVFDRDEQPRIKFIYADRESAQIARDAMFKVVESAVSLDGISRR